MAFCRGLFHTFRSTECISRQTIRRIILCVSILLVGKALRLSNAPEAIISSLINSRHPRDFDLEFFDENSTKNIETGSQWRAKLVPKAFAESSISNEGPKKPSCPEIPLDLIGVSVIADVSSPLVPGDDVATIAKLSKGGRYSPSNCKARYRVAIIIPIRNRDEQLRVLLSQMHPIWQRQQLDYTVYAVTQSGYELFNRAKLMNIGVSEAIKEREYDCYVFHDADLLVEDDRCLYACHDENPRHLAMHVDAFSYEPLSYGLSCNPPSLFLRKVRGFGGVSMLSKQQFADVNGFSNLYWGWGAEDDDMYLRIQSKGYSVVNPYGKHCSFRMIKHEHEGTNAKNPGREALLFHSVSRMNSDGYSSLRYKVLSVERNNLYTNITVDVGRPSERMKKFISQNFHWLTMCIVKMPWNM